MTYNSKLKNLVLFRHGKAQRPYDALDDFSRNLVERGKKDSENQAQRLKDLGFWPNIIYSSSAHRAAQTCENAIKIFENVETIITRDLYLASPKIYLETALNANVENVIIIAHDPGLHDLCRHFMKNINKIDDLSNDAQMLLYELPTAGIAWFQKNDDEFKLLHHLRPLREGF